jgi:uncharacterized protein YndB with AHSA1/START domain
VSAAVAGTRVSDEQHHPAPPAEVYAVLTDPAFLTAYAAELGAHLDGVGSTGLDGHRRTELRLRVPTRGIPPAFVRFVGAEVAVTDVRSWRSDGDGGFAAAWEVRARIFGRDAIARGTSVLRPGAGGTVATTAGRVTVDAPVVGRQAEAAVGQLVVAVLRREAELLRRRLGGDGRASSSA